jgi:hypothetical protein
MQSTLKAFTMGSGHSSQSHGKHSAADNRRTAEAQSAGLGTSATAFAALPEETPTHGAASSPGHLSAQSTTDTEPERVPIGDRQRLRSEVGQYGV